MQEFLDFIQLKVGNGTFIGVSTQVFNEEQTIYVVDYWEITTEVRNGKQKMFLI